MTPLTVPTIILFRNTPRRDGKCRTNESADQSCQQSHVQSNPAYACSLSVLSSSVHHIHHTHGTGRQNSPIRVINLRLPTQQLPLPRLISPSPPHQIPILLRLKHRYQMYARPHLLAGEFTARKSPSQFSPLKPYETQPKFQSERIQSCYSRIAATQLPSIITRCAVV